MRRATLHALCGLVSVWLLASVAVRAQDNSQGSGTAAPAAASNAAPGAAPDPSKKVWTNEDVAGLRDSTTLSTFSSAKTKAPAGATRPAKTGTRNATWYHDQIAKLQAEVPPLNDQIAALQAAIDGKPTGDEKTSSRPYGVKIDSWTEQRDSLTKKRDGILAQIDSLRDEARHNGIPDSALP
jgi:hypothetical protein